MYLGATDNPFEDAIASALDRILKLADLGEEELASLRVDILQIPPVKRRGTGLNSFLKQYKEITGAAAKAAARAKAKERIMARQAAGEPGFQPPAEQQEEEASSKTPLLIVGGIGAVAILAFVLLRKRK